MKWTASIGGAAIAIVAIAIAVAGCGGSQPSKTSAPSNSSASGSGALGDNATSQSKVAPRIARMARPRPSRATQGQPYQRHTGAQGRPRNADLNFPIPDGWADAGPDTPPTAYWAIVDNAPGGRQIHAQHRRDSAKKLQGDVDPQKLIELASDATKTCPASSKWATATKTTWADSPAYQLGGTWDQDGKDKAVAEKVVVINGKDDVIYLLELSADCLPDQVQQALPATITIKRKDDDQPLALASPFR